MVRVGTTKNSIINGTVKRHKVRQKPGLVICAILCYYPSHILIRTLFEIYS